MRQCASAWIVIEMLTLLYIPLPSSTWGTIVWVLPCVNNKTYTDTNQLYNKN